MCWHVCCVIQHTFLPEVGRGASPRSRIDVGDRLRERPVVTGQVERAVLPLAVRVVGRWLKDPCTRALGLLVVAVGIVDAHEHRVRDRIGSDASLGPARRDDDRAVSEDKLRAMVSDAKTLLESERAAEPVTRLGHVVVGQHGNDGGAWHRTVDDHVAILTGGPSWRAATYAQRIKNKTAKARKPAARAAAKSAPAAAPKPAAATAPKPPPPSPTPAAPPLPSGELQRLRDELQRVNQEISRIARLTRPGSDPARNSQLPEKQQLLSQRQDLERKIRTLSKA